MRRSLIPPQVARFILSPLVAVLIGLPFLGAIGTTTKAAPRHAWIVDERFASGRHVYVGTFPTRARAQHFADFVSPADWADPVGVVRPLQRP